MCDGMSLSGQLRMALCKWQPGPFSHSSQPMQPLTSQRKKELAQPVPLAKSTQSARPDYTAKCFRGSSLWPTVVFLAHFTSPPMRKETIALCVTIVIILLINSRIAIRPGSLSWPQTHDAEWNSIRTFRFIRVRMELLLSSRNQRLRLAVRDNHKGLQRTWLSVWSQAEPASSAAI